MQSKTPKQFIEINGEAIVVRTIKAFLNYDAGIKIIISVHTDFKIHLQKLIDTQLAAKNNITIAIGGDTRFQSVKNGLAFVDEDTAIVGIHDAARPLVSIKTITNAFKGAKEMGNATPCIAINESLRSVTNHKNSSVNRNDFKIIQTPQCFLVSKIKQAFTQEYNPTFTDDATVLEAMGEHINLVEGNIENIKITTQFDLSIVKALLDNE